jgi:hypothetical protein
MWCERTEHPRPKILRDVDRGPPQHAGRIASSVRRNMQALSDFAIRQRPHIG